MKKALQFFFNKHEKKKNLFDFLFNFLVLQTIYVTTERQKNGLNGPKQPNRLLFCSEREKSLGRYLLLFLYSCVCCMCLLYVFVLL